MNRATRGLLMVHDGVEKAVTIALLLALMVVVVWATALYSVELLGLIAQRVTTGKPAAGAPVIELLSRLRVLHEVFSGFLLILMGVELLRTIAMYLMSHEMHVEVVFTVAIIAVARHAIDLDLAHMEPMQVAALGVLLLAIALGYYLFRRVQAMPAAPPHETDRPGGSSG